MLSFRFAKPYFCQFDSDILEDKVQSDRYICVLLFRYEQKSIAHDIGWLGDSHENKGFCHR
jgi:hypothetical protein